VGIILRLPSRGRVTGFGKRRKQSFLKRREIRNKFSNHPFSPRGKGKHNSTPTLIYLKGVMLKTTKGHGHAFNDETGEF